MGVFIAGVIGLLTRRLWMSLALLAVAGVWLAAENAEPNLHLKIRNMLDLGLPFAAGTALWLWKDRVALTIWGVVALWAATVALAATPLYGLLLVLALAYTTFWLAYIPGGWIRRYDEPLSQHGDCRAAHADPVDHLMAPAGETGARTAQAHRGLVYRRADSQRNLSLR